MNSQFLPLAPINGKILETMQAKISDLLKQKRLSKVARLQCEVMELMVLYMMEDHPKTRKMYQVFVPTLWLFSIAVVALITAITSGHLQIAFTVK
jgi:hypothetical protein